MTDDKPTFADYMQAGMVPLPAAATAGNTARQNINEPLLPPPTAGDTTAPVAEQHRKNGIATKTWQELQRNRSQARLDMHGLTVQEAHAALEKFLKEALQHNQRMVEIIHGRGLRSEGGTGVLRNATRYWLQQCHWVLAYCEPPQNSGSVSVLLRQPRSAKK